MSAKPGLRAWLSSYSGQKHLITVMFLLIPVILLLLFTAIPAVQMLIYSFQDRNMLRMNAWVGLDNYKTVFTDTAYISTLQTSLYYFVGSFLQIIIALVIAYILCSNLRAKNVFKGILFFPFMMNGIAVSLIFRRFFQKGDGITNTEGTLNAILEVLGGEPRRWLMDSPVMANICLVFVSMWRHIGFDIIMFIGALMAVPSDLGEAASIDGAGAWQRFKYIAFPIIRPIIALQMILAVRGAISVFEIPYIITSGRFGTNTFVIQTMSTAFESRKVGLGAAMAIVLLAIIIVITIIQKAYFREREK